MTRRAFVLGLLMASWVNLWPSYSALVIDSSRADYAHLSVAVMIPFVFLLAFNHWVRGSWLHLSASELITIVCMGMVAALMQGEWLAGYFLGAITAPTYFATPENRWDDLLLQYIPTWSIVDRNASIGFYEGLPLGQHIPWASWIVPLFWWGLFLGAVLLVCFCLSVILRKQWMEHERLAFPIATALLELTGVSGTKSTLSDLLRVRLFWVGFWVILGIIIWNISTWFFIAMPPLPVLYGKAVRTEIVFGTGFPPLLICISVMTLVFGYFTKSEILLSIWFFHFLAILQAGLLNRFGVDIGSSDPWGSFHPIIGWQSFGGLIVLVMWGLWMARSHLKDVFRKAFVGDDAVDDKEELISYRLAVGLLMGSALFLMFWLKQAGMDWGPLVAFWFATLVLYLGVARIIVESGLVFLRGPITAQAFTWHLFGFLGMGPYSAVALGLTWTFFCDAKTFGMTALAHIPRLGAAMNRESRRRLVPAVMLASLVGAATVIGFTLYYGYYVTGSYNFGVVSFNGSSDSAIGSWRLTASRIQAGTMDMSWDRIGFLAVGAAVVGALSYVRFLFPGFPIHPMGFAISAASSIRNISLSVFIIWAVKGLVLRLGGLDLYRRLKPFFLGMLAGYLVGIALGVVVDFIWFPGSGHDIHVTF